jgi:GNAT superfamily N-acetyltransferase
MYTDPAHVRRGVGRMIMDACESAARAESFTHVELAATLAGEPLYRACGYDVIEHFKSHTSAGVEVPLLRMGKAL